MQKRLASGSAFFEAPAHYGMAITIRYKPDIIKYRQIFPIEIRKTRAMFWHSSATYLPFSPNSWHKLVYYFGLLI